MNSMVTNYDTEKRVTDGSVGTRSSTYGHSEESSGELPFHSERYRKYVRVSVCKYRSHGSSETVSVEIYNSDSNPEGYRGKKTAHSHLNGSLENSCFPVIIRSRAVKSAEVSIFKMRQKQRNLTLTLTVTIGGKQTCRVSLRNKLVATLMRHTQLFLAARRGGDRPIWPAVEISDRCRRYREAFVAVVQEIAVLCYGTPSPEQRIPTRFW